MKLLKLLEAIIGRIDKYRIKKLKAENFKLRKELLITKQKCEQLKKYY